MRLKFLLTVKILRTIRVRPLHGTRPMTFAICLDLRPYQRIFTMVKIVCGQNKKEKVEIILLSFSAFADHSASQTSTSIGDSERFPRNSMVYRTPREIYDLIQSFSTTSNRDPIRPNAEPTMPTEATTNDSSASTNQRPILAPSFLNPPTNSSVSFRNQAASRCPFIINGDRNRRFHCNGAHHHYPYAMQNGAYQNVRPAYAPHETLWYRQQNNQELHRRHFMNHISSLEASTDFSNPSTSRLNASTANQPSNSIYCQHAAGLPRHQSQHYRCSRSHACTDPRRHRTAYAAR